MNGSGDIRELLLQARSAIDAAIEHVDRTRKAFREQIASGDARRRKPVETPTANAPPADQPSTQSWREVEMPYGKYRGKCLSEVPVGYLQWCLEKTDIKSDALRRSISAAVQARAQ